MFQDSEESKVNKSFYVFTLFLFLMAPSIGAEAQDKLAKFRFVHLEANDFTLTPSF